jgi:catechol 2,3-dioxygenase-like lactoylglutathione lyase family enzyme
MRLLRLAWLGIPTAEYEAMLRFFRDVLGLKVEFAQPTTVELSTASDDRIQLFAPGDRYFELFDESVPLFEVEDLEAARRELEQASVEVVGEIEADTTWRWITVRAPNGHLYQLGARR